MRTVSILALYAFAMFALYAGLNMEGAAGLNHHVAPQTDAELMAAAFIIMGSMAKLAGHAVLLSLTNAKAR